jgi:hypothetical protein
MRGREILGDVGWSPLIRRQQTITSGIAPEAEEVTRWLGPGDIDLLFGADRLPKRSIGISIQNIIYRPDLCPLEGRKSPWL